MRRSAPLLALLMIAALVSFASRAVSDELPEYRLKAAFLYNFALFTEWPSDVGLTLNMCIYGQDPFGPEIDGLQGKAVGDRHIAVHRSTTLESLNGCQIVFVARSAAGGMPRVIASLRDAAVLTVADSPGAIEEGAALNMSVVNGRITFEANLQAARSAKLNLSSKLLRLATKVRQ